MKRAASVVALVLSSFVLAGGAHLASAAGQVRTGAASCAVPTVPAADVPWGEVGAGWLVASWEPHPVACHLVRYLDLVSPVGTQYPLYRLPSGFTSVVAWSGDGSRVVTVTIRFNATSQSTVVRTLALKTGAVIGSFVEANTEGPRFSLPSGTQLLGAKGDGLVRMSFDGVVQARFPGTFAGVHAWDGSWIESADGTELAFGAKNGIALLSNSGATIATLPIHGATQCSPVQWWSATVVLASCLHTVLPGHTVGPNLYEFSSSWASPRELTTPPVAPDYGDANAWRLAGKTFVQELASCGPPSLGVLHGHQPTLIHLPGTDTAAVIGTTSTSLAVASADCTGSTIVDWYEPATNSIVRVLGPPVLGGFLGGVVAFPTPTDQGLTFP